MFSFPAPCKGKSKSQPFAHTFALTGRGRLYADTQGVALGYGLTALSGRSRHCPKRFRDISGLVILIGEAFAACRRVDDATIAEAGFEDEVTHEVVVAMCVDAKRVVAVHGIAQDELHDAVCLTVARHAMDGGVGAGGGPGSVVDDGIRGVVARAKHEGGDEAALLLDGVAGAGGDVGKEDVVTGIAVDPLGGVTALRHEAAGTGEELLEGGEVGGTRGTHEVLAAEGDAVALGSKGMGGDVGDVGHGGKGFFWREIGGLGAPAL